ncbi:Fic family protein [Candidatus Dependentiae bacterium]|nr:Fic family protein [Candidatus Dependentiae bacterium]
MRKTGFYESLGNFKHFVPYPLPPQDPPLTLDAETTSLYGQAMHQLGKLNEIVNILPDKNRFIKAYVTKEALLSSAIEGIHTTLLEIYTQPLTGLKPNKNIQLVMNYTRALHVAIEMIQKKDLPISTRVLLKTHKVLMEGGEGEKANPGNYRKQPVRVGNLIPPPAAEISNLMSDLEKFINTNETFPMLIKAGLAHIQFETIHPFLDGNGRIGRLLIVLMLIENKILSEPILYPSYYFKKHHLEYYQKLDRVRTEGDFEGWIKFYLTAIRDTAIDAYQRAKDIEKLRKQLMQIILEDKKFIKSRDIRLEALNILFSSPIINIREMSLQLGTSYNTANKIISDFLELDFLVKETKQKRGKLFRFKKYWDILDRE